MNSRASRRFWQLYNGLPERIRDAADKQYALWRENPRHRSLRFKRIRDNLWSARVTDDVLRTLVLASYLLGVERAMIIAHTDCRMAAGTEEEVHAAVREAGGPDTRSLSFLVTDDVEATVRADVQRVQSWPYLTNLRVGGFLYDIGTGRLAHIC